MTKAEKIYNVINDANFASWLERVLAEYHKNDSTDKKRSTGWQGKITEVISRLTEYKTVKSYDYRARKQSKADIVFIRNGKRYRGEIKTGAGTVKTSADYHKLTFDDSDLRPDDIYPHSDLIMYCAEATEIIRQPEDLLNGEKIAELMQAVKVYERAEFIELVRMIGLKHGNSQRKVINLRPVGKKHWEAYKNWPNLGTAWDWMTEEEA